MRRLKNVSSALAALAVLASTGTANASNSWLQDVRMATEVPSAPQSTPYPSKVSVSFFQKAKCEGNCVKFTVTYKTCNLDANGKPTNIKEKSFFWDMPCQTKAQTGSFELASGEYAYGDATVEIKKRPARGTKWEEFKSGKVDISSGKLSFATEGDLPNGKFSLVTGSGYSTFGGSSAASTSTSATASTQTTSTSVGRGRPTISRTGTERGTVENKINRTSNTATSTSSSNDKARRDAINNGIAGLKAKSNLRDFQINYNAEKQADYQITNQGLVLVQQVERTLSKDDADVLFAISNRNEIFPGAIVYVDQNLANGKPRLFTDGGYGKVTVSLDFDNGGKASRTGIVNSPNAINSAIDEMIREAYTSGYRGGAKANGMSKTFESSRTAAFSLGCDVNFLEVTCNAKVNTNSSKIENLYIHDLSQVYYTVTITLDPDKSNYFGSDASWEKMQRGLENKALAIISSVSYGRRLYHFKKFSSSAFRLNASQTLKAYGQKLESSQSVNDSTVSVDEWGYALGGSNKAAAANLRGDQLKQALQDTEFDISKANQGVPLSFKALFIANNELAKVSSTTKYYETTYSAYPKTINVDIYNGAKVVGATKMYVDMWYNTFSYDTRTKKKTPVQTDKKWNMSWSERGRKNDVIKLGPNEYFEPIADIRITHKHGAGPAFDTNVSSKGQINIADGYLKLDIEGSCYKGQSDPKFTDAHGGKTLLK